MDGTIRTADEHPVRFDLADFENPVYKPFRFHPWAYEGVAHPAAPCPLAA